ncbi:MAG: FmdB family zinc ribbon protein [Actinomycetota bacterium]
MPTYEYRCRSCDATFEARRTIADADVEFACPQGHTDTTRRPSVFGVATTTSSEERAPSAMTGCGHGCTCVPTGRMA